MRTITSTEIQSLLGKKINIKSLYENIKNDLHKVEGQLKLFSQSQNKLISEVSGYLFKNSGKRIRPALLVLCSKLLGYQGKEHILMGALVETSPFSPDSVQPDNSYLDRDFYPNDRRRINRILYERKS